MRCIRCHQELKDNAMFCVHCGEKTPNKIANYLRVTGIIDLVLSIIVIITELTTISESIRLIGVPHSILGIIVYLFWIYVAIMIIKHSHNYIKANHLKELSIVYMIVTILNGLISSPIIYKVAFDEVKSELGYNPGIGWFMGGMIAWGLIASCIIPSLYIIFTSKIEKMYIKSIRDSIKDKNKSESEKLYLKSVQYRRDD